MEKTNEIIANISYIPDFKPAQIKGLMNDLNMDERAFALIMNVEPMAVRLWTSGAVHPNGTARRLMEIYQRMPRVLDCLAERKSDDGDGLVH